VQQGIRWVLLALAAGVGFFLFIARSACAEGPPATVAPYEASFERSLIEPADRVSASRERSSRVWSSPIAG
jgi:hypothetical protein